MIALPKLKLTYRGVECDTFIINELEIGINDLLFNDLIGQIIIPDFTFCKTSIIECLLKNEEFHEKSGKGDVNNSYQIFKEFIIIYKGKKRTETLCSYENKFLQDFIDLKTAYALEKYDKHKCATCAQDAKSDFCDTYLKNSNVFFSNNLLKKIFPPPDDEVFYILQQAKKYVSAFFYVKEPKEYFNIYSYDRKSAFPAAIYNGCFPSGRESKDEGEERKWHIYLVRIYKAEPMVYDFLGLAKEIKENNYFPLNVWLTEEMLEVFEKTYKNSYHILNAIVYKLQKSIFDDFFINNIYNQKNDFSPIKKYNKAKNNLFIGTFGKETIYNVTHYTMENDKICFKTDTKVRDENAYMALYLYVNGRAKRDFITFLFENFQHIIYANTDGFFSDIEISTDKFNGNFTNNIGAFEFREFYNRIAIKELSNYCGEYVDADGVVRIDYRLSGRKANIESYQQFVNGYKSLGVGITPYGFITSYEIEELSLAEYIENYKNQSVIENLANQFMLYQKESDSKRKAHELNERQQAELNGHYATDFNTEKMIEKIIEIQRKRGLTN